MTLASRVFNRTLLCWLVIAVVLLAGSTQAKPAPTLLVLGDSISAGYGLTTGQGWVALLAQRLAREGYPQQVVNASISGDTTAGGNARLPALLRKYRPAIVIIELGGNDALRGGDLVAARDNLDAMVRAAQAAGAKALLLGMRVPPNYGPRYAQDFAALYASVAATRHVALVPWLFEGFGEDLSKFQADRIHPVVAVQPRILDNAWPTLRPLLGRR